MLGSQIKVRSKVARRSLTVLGAGVAMAAVLLSSGTAAFAKSNISMKANHKTIKVGHTIQFSGSFGDDWATGVNGDQVCLWQYVKGAPVRQLAPCVALRQRDGKPLKSDSFEGYFRVTIKAMRPGRLTVVPVVRTSYDPKAVYRYAQTTIVVTRVGH
jgi:hypothetical protein